MPRKSTTPKQTLAAPVNAPEGIVPVVTRGLEIPG
jgi:hypothetical protein